MAQWFWRRSQCIFTISQLSTLWKRCGPSLEQIWISFTRGYFVPSLVAIGPVVLEKKMKIWKVYRQTDRWWQQVIRKAYLSFQLRWAKKYYIAMLFQHKYQFIGSKYFSCSVFRFVLQIPYIVKSLGCTGKFSDFQQNRKSYVSKSISQLKYSYL